jgi:DNA mismatch endonuclease, patch repair protein
MSRVRTRDTAPEVALRRALWAAGVPGWRLHPKGVPGRPDVVFGRGASQCSSMARFGTAIPTTIGGSRGRSGTRKISRNHGLQDFLRPCALSAGIAPGIQPATFGL